ncbi:MAG: hypothetical protein ACRD82_12275 [Blastocatellia bacterium]
MKNFARLICSISLLPLLAVVALCSQFYQHNLRFVDPAGKPISDVIVQLSVSASPPAGGSGTFNHKSDADGRVSIAHPCAGGSCCFFISASYKVIGKFGYNISGGASLACGGPSIDITIVGTIQEYTKLSVVSAANFREPLSSEMIATAFGANLAPTTEVASLPLPTTLGNRRVYVRDSDGSQTLARLLLVSPGQINFILPIGTSPHIVIVSDENNQIIGTGFPALSSIAPGIFTANSDGQGVPAAVIVRARADGSQQYEPVAQFDQTLRRFVPMALDLGPESDIIILALFGTGWRYFFPATLTVKIGGIECPVEYVGKQPNIEGLDQINVRLPRNLIGKGDVTVEVQFNYPGANSVEANPVQLKIK